MAHGVITDNWSLQDISDLLLNGMDETVVKEIVVDDRQHYYCDRLQACIQTEALFDFMTDVVLRDEIIVDQSFEHSWFSAQSPLIKEKKENRLK
ncbi:hypothetical protein D5R81_14050 [Parashewanella spongiae]|uniref:Uncharacterized protein n=1 Tax=Parashewanella spongiae TaxID=342950 RepID=A0A3A6TGY6_9GAMM|nr:hypothetical protein [Parashewanella spongiae]MCL1079080.1 hypothetical protein [Parashewanella spongiae]RJY10693.1 hypothetical protein D5R81_14050 [Parashewanella spongiae]